MRDYFNCVQCRRRTQQPAGFNLQCCHRCSNDMYSAEYQPTAIRNMERICAALAADRRRDTQHPASTGGDGES